ncbi:hypothetical protein [Mailhella massiliensis]|uniref:hypothetical protein n=1 Tax=Mailhella massiliensis TaxID=1903261 RepID=UPI00097DF812|nr:hypothetical protein [Mailhella massiliensis]
METRTTKNGFVEAIDSDKLADIMVGALSADSVLQRSGLCFQALVDAVTEEADKVARDPGLTDIGKGAQWQAIYDKYTAQKKIDEVVPPYMLKESGEIVSRQAAAIENLRSIKLPARGEQAFINELRAREIREYARGLSQAAMVAFYMNGSDEIQAALESTPIAFGNLPPDVVRRVTDARAEKVNPALVESHRAMQKLVTSLESNYKTYPVAVAVACRLGADYAAKKQQLDERTAQRNAQLAR